MRDMESLISVHWPWFCVGAWATISQCLYLRGSYSSVMVHCIWFCVGAVATTTHCMYFTASDNSIFIHYYYYSVSLQWQQLHTACTSGCYIVVTWYPIVTVATIAHCMYFRVSHSSYMIPDCHSGNDCTLHVPQGVTQQCFCTLCIILCHRSGNHWTLHVLQGVTE